MTPPPAAIIKKAAVNRDYANGLNNQVATYLNANGQTLLLIYSVCFHPGHSQNDYE
jgi:hypothetical protein